MGNTGVTKVGVVERGALQRDDAREDRIDSRGKIIELQGEAGSGALPGE